MNKTKKTLILGATARTGKYANTAALMLMKRGFKVDLLGNSQGDILGQSIKTSKEDISDIDTVTVYLSPKNQIDYEDFIIKLNPKRVIFNPGAENEELEKKLIENNIESINACTLVMISTEQF
jgi:predicted CoA-binding protein